MTVMNYLKNFCGLAFCLISIIMNKALYKIGSGSINVQFDYVFHALLPQLVMFGLLVLFFVSELLLNKSDSYDHPYKKISIFISAACAVSFVVFAVVTYIDTNMDLYFDISLITLLILNVYMLLSAVIKTTSYLKLSETVFLLSILESFIFSISLVFLIKHLSLKSSLYLAEMFPEQVKSTSIFLIAFIFSFLSSIITGEIVKKRARINNNFNNMNNYR